MKGKSHKPQEDNRQGSCINNDHSVYDGEVVSDNANCGKRNVVAVLVMAVVLGL